MQFPRFIRHFRRPRLFVSLIVAVAAVLIMLSTSGDGDPRYVFAERGTAYEEVRIAGKTKPHESATLSFERSGKVAAIHVDIGDRVEKGTPLIALDAAESTAAYEEAQAAFQTQQAKLEELVGGTRPEERAIQTAKLEDTRHALEDTEASLRITLLDAYTKADDAVRNKADQLMSNARSTTPSFNFTADQNLKTHIETERTVVENLLRAWQDPLRDAPERLDGYAARIRENLGTTAAFLALIASAVNDLQPGGTLTAATISGYRADLAAARTNVNAAITDVVDGRENVRSARSTLMIAERELALTDAGADANAIAAQRAAVAQAAANAAVLRARLAQAALRSPLRGIVTKQDAELGATVNAHVPLVTVIADDLLEIEATVPEVSIGNIQVGNPAIITLDAFPGETFRGTVSFIDPAETVIDGIVNFKITIAFEARDPRMKSGLTANVLIRTREKEDALLLQLSAVLETDAGTFVRTLESGKETEVPVTLGIRGTDGRVEVLSGLREGEAVISANGSSQKE